MDNESRRHVTVLIPASLNRWLRVRAAELDTSRSELIRAILAKEAAAQSPDDLQEVRDG